MGWGRGALAGAVLLACGCAPRESPVGPGGAPVEVVCCGQEDPVEVTYLGVGGWLVRHRGHELLTAPFFSNPSMVRTGLRAIAADTGRIDRALARLPDLSTVPAILVGHAHYDHLMDVPYVMDAHAPRAHVWGNRTMAYQLAPFLRARGIDGARVHVVEDSAGSADGPGRWLDVAPGVRAMPLLSAHGPHFAGYTLYSGDRIGPVERPPATASDWLDGRTLAWLVDLVDASGGTAFRIYYQDAVVAAPYGLPPELDDGHGVDLAIVVPATFAEVPWHPERVVRATRPRHVLLGHWESFFRDPLAPPEPVTLLDVDGFLDRLDAVLPEGSGRHLPAPGTRFVFTGGGQAP